MKDDAARAKATGLGGLLKQMDARLGERLQADIKRLQGNPEYTRLGHLPGDELGYVAPKGQRAMPAQRPGKSKQDYATPDDFIAAVKKRFGIREFAWDLAADASNTKAVWFFDEEDDSLKQDWTKLKGDLWLNPPFADIDPWAAKCAAANLWGCHSGRLARIFFLTPLSSANWFARHVDGKALVILLNGRLSFDGKAPYPKDCMISCFGVKPGYECWNWRK